MDIQVKSAINEQAVAELSRVSFIHLAKVFAILAVLFCGTGVILLIAGFDKGVSVSMIIAGLIMPAGITVGTYLYLPYCFKKPINFAHNPQQEFTFSEDKIFLCEKSDVCEAKDIEYLWDAFYRAVETKDYFFLYLNKYNAFILSKSGFIQGSAEDLRSEFSKRFQKRFSCKEK